MNSRHASEIAAIWTLVIQGLRLTYAATTLHPCHLVGYVSGKPVDLALLEDAHVIGRWSSRILVSWVNRTQKIDESRILDLVQHTSGQIKGYIRAETVLKYSEISRRYYGFLQN